MNGSHARRAPLSWCIGWGLMLLAWTSNAQTNSFSFSFNDPDRNGREIPVNFHHDLGTEGPAPLVVIAHGFVMTPADYDDLVENLVGEGYVVGVVDTETGFAPSHGDFALDLAFVIRHAAQQVAELEGWLGSASALIGHSMGGGASWLAAADLGNELDALIGLAPAETTPSALAAGTDVVTPTLLISGSSDEVTPPDTQHVPLYNSLQSVDCRTWVSLVNGGHCGFADAGSLCDFGEITFAGMPREEQQELSFTAVVAFLSYHLGTDALGMLNLEAMAIESASVELTLACDWTGVTEVPEVGLAAPNPASSRVQVPQFGLDGTWRAFDLHGRELPLRWLGAQELSVDGWPQGLVLLTWTSLRGGAVWRTSITVAR